VKLFHDFVEKIYASQIDQYDNERSFLVVRRWTRILLR
jgi:hypothetical protein